MKKIIVASLALALMFAMAQPAPVVAADQAQSITMSPTNQRQSIKPGQTVTSSVTVTNSGKGAYNFSVYARPYSVNSEAYEPAFDGSAANADAHTWVQFAKSKYRVEPGKSVEVTYTMTVPVNAKSGGHYAVLFAETEVKSNESTAIKRSKRVGAILYTTVSGNNTAKGSVLATELAFLQNSSPLVASSRVQNTGNIDFIDKTNFIVKDVFGSVKYSSSRELVVLPATTRAIDYQWKNNSAVGLYKVTVSHDMLKNKTQESRYILIIPVWLLILVVLLMIGAAYVFTIKQRKH